jgi:RNA polymerase sigma-70 factor (sigma-E family)
MDTPSRPPLTPDHGISGLAGPAAGDDATSGVTAVYQAHAVGLIRLAIVMLGDRTAAEDVVQDAFFGLYRHWTRLTDPANALPYVRSAVLRQRGRPWRHEAAAVASESAEATVLVGEAHQEVLAAIRALPHRQREVLVLRYYVDLSEEETARAMGISRGTVKSTTSRAVAALGRMLKEDQ